MTRAQIAALVVGLGIIFGVAEVFGIGDEGATPWYTRPGAAAIVGAFIGGASAAVTSYLADQRRFKREDKYRDHSERRQAYTEFLTSWHSLEETKRRSNPPASWQEREEAQLQFQRSLNIVSLIAPKEVREAAFSMEKEEPGAPGRFWTAARKDLDKPPE